MNLLVIRQNLSVAIWLQYRSNLPYDKSRYRMKYSLSSLSVSGSDVLMFTLRVGFYNSYVKDDIYLLSFWTILLLYWPEFS